ncbi:MAG TPA: putative baseplate assembly protein [Blastocatellia bacterium]|nr:putative baseplate assembly protein [Blastocatellia bacterium]
MTMQPPKIDSRSAGEVAQKVRDLLKEYAPEWKGDGNDPLATALIGVFARYAEIVIDRLNRAPEKNFLAYLDLLGASLLPPQPASALLTFSLAEGSVVDGIVHRGAQVAAPPAEGEENPVIFETDRDLVVTAARLDSVFVIEPEQDRFSDCSAADATADGCSLFEGEAAIDHIFYIGDREIFDLQHLAQVKLEMDFESVSTDEMLIRWDRWAGAEWEEIASITIEAGSSQATIDLCALQPIPLSALAGLESRWVRGRLETPITLSDTPQTGKARAGQLPTLSTLNIAADFGGSVSVEQSFTNQFPLDTSKEFFPFGEKPRVGDAWLIGQNEAFSQPGARITLDITLAGSAPTEGRPALKWEIWNGAAWEELKATSGEPQEGELFDNTENLTTSGDVTLRLRGPSVSREINGVQGNWLRVRIASGNYGIEAQYTLKTDGKPEDGYMLTPATFAPPIISPVKVTYDGSRSAAPEAGLASNNFVLMQVLSEKDLTSPPPAPAFAEPLPLTSRPFLPVSDPAIGGVSRPTFYLGFVLPTEGGFPQRAVSIYFGLRTPLFGEAPAQTEGQPSLVWEYWSGGQWSRLIVSDGTAALTRPGLIDFLPPADFAMRTEFDRQRYWLRVRWNDGQYQFIPQANRILLNTTTASQAVTVRNEILGSSDGSKNQTFSATKTPILSGQRLEVREPETPPIDEQQAIELEEGEDAITVIPESAGQAKEIWVRWHQTPDFYGSGPRDHHYVLDHLTGEIRFGDGLSGLIPPAGVSNLRLAEYRVGGGEAGNRPAGAIVQLKTTVPYVDRVTNYEAAAGGADAESMDALIERAPRVIRHNYRAVTVEDFEDMSMLASPEVARAKCAPLRDLAGDPLDQDVPIDPLTGAPGVRGWTSVIVVPRSTEPKPLPNLELIQRVQAHLEAHAATTASISVVGPLYLRVNVEAEIAPASLEDAVEIELATQQTLDAFLHPLTGGLDGEGWDFGREPHLSDFYTLIEGIAGVDHVNQLKLTEEVDEGDVESLGLDADSAVAAVKGTGRFLVCSGAHKITLKFER